ncbi:hypothetical protein LCGC14_0141190 [marine sediment metagenome]|uniref:Uncharacterized protein n=1 Tax=marine sediment metagenome TaxID=412755 RepID=A0A0F9Y2J4_9ZZZZ
MPGTQSRLYYAIQAVGFAPHDTLCPLDAANEHPGSGTHPSGFITAHGMQSVSLNTTFNLDPLFQLGQLELYENVEGIPEIEMTAQKVLDGYPLLYHLATPGASSATLVGRSSERCFVGLNVYPDTFDNASGTPLQSVGMSGMYVSSLGYTLNVEGSSTEDVTLVGNDKEWTASGLDHFVPTEFDGADVPQSLAASGGIARRENILMGSGCSMDSSAVITGTSGSIFPTDIDGISADGWNLESGDSFAAHLQTINVNVDLGREELFELGRRGAYYRFVAFPTEVTCSIEITTSQGDLVDAMADPVGGSNLTNQKIFFWVEEGTRINLGTKNKLASITYGGGDTGGGNVQTVLNYQNFNSCTVTHVSDPAGLST